jgi:hypothetical protein
MAADFCGWSWSAWWCRWCAAEDGFFCCSGERGLGLGGQADAVPVEDHVQCDHVAESAGELACFAEALQVGAGVGEDGVPVVARTGVAEQEEEDYLASVGISWVAAALGIVSMEKCGMSLIARLIEYALRMN